MAAAVCCTAVGDSLAQQQQQKQQADGAHQQAGPAHAPINFLYGHLHNSIRTELDNLSTWALSLEADDGEEDRVLRSRLLHLKERYHFLEQVYKYHSSVEDEVVYPALDTKVKNVTSAYSVEHQDEEYLFEHLAGLLASALSQAGAERTATIRRLVCKVEEIHITLRKHLAKEEAQLLPLLLQHFSRAEQAELVAQFLYCIPLDTVERVLAWLKPVVPMDELLELMHHLRDVIPDNLLLELLVSWLNPAPAPAGSAGGGGAGGGAVAGSGSGSGAAEQQAQAQAEAGGRPLVICPFASGAAKQPPAAAPAAAAGGGEGGSSSGGAPAEAAASCTPSAEQWPPLRGIVLFHHSIRGALEVFAAEAAALQAQSGVTAGQLGGLVERHRFLRSVCMFHTLSEEEVLFPEVVRIGGLEPQRLASVLAACSTCQEEHGSEVQLFEELGRLLADVRAHVRRGRTRDVSGMLGQLVHTARRVCSAIGSHMQREEQQVLPLLAAALAPDQQRGMVWHTLRAMPLRLLERVLPWLLSKLSAEDADGMMANLRLGAPEVDQQLVELLLRWAQRGRWPLPDAGVPGAAGRAAAAAPAGPEEEEAAPPPLPSPRPAPAGEGPQDAAEPAATVATAAAPAAAAAAAAAELPEGLRGRVPASLLEALCRAPDLPAGREAAQPGSPGVAAAAAADGAGQHQDQHQQQQQQQQQQGFATHDPCFFANNTCELRLIRQGSSGGGSESPRGAKRQRRGDASGPSEGGSSSSPDATPTAAAAAAAAEAGQAAAPGDLVGAAAALACAVTIQGLITEQQQGGATATAAAEASSGAAGQVAGAAAGAQAGAPLPPAAAGGGSGGAAAATAGRGSGAATAAAASTDPTGCNPIDHIFQFHKALRRELKQLESDAAALEQEVLACWEPPPPAAAAQQQQQPPEQQQQPPEQPQPEQQQPEQQQPGQQQPGQQQPGQQPAAAAAAAAPAPLPRRVARALQQLDGRFQFLWGIYRAHSKAEDEIVFPALESKEALHNVSHAYTLDHEQEERLFLDLASVISRVKSASSPLEARDLALQLRRMCAAVRASLETHVRAEEAELWPLFSEHFSVKEQQHLVGVIIGRTGAEVLQALLPWVTGSFSEEEKEAMMGSLREATKNTMFDQWLGAVQGGGAAAGAAAPQRPEEQPGQQQAAAAAQQQQQQQQLEDLAEVAEYLAGALAGCHGGGPDAACPFPSSAPQQQLQPPQTEVSGTVAESTNYVPGWEEIFNINQKQLEAAVRRVSNDPTLEPQRKAYLLQQIMVSRYIVAQQRRMQGGGGGGAAGATAAGGAQATAAPAGGHGCGHEHHGGGALPCAHHHHHHHHHHEQHPQQQEQQQHPQQPPQPQAAPAAASAPGQPARTYADAAAGVLGCRHYRRSAQLVAPCCGQVYTCRLCHDEASDHRLDRYSVGEMVCMLCGARQPVGASCGACGGRMASYYCGICHLFDDEPGRDIYHCPFCNVCRRGRGLGVDFFHCMQCNACMSLSLFSSHTCRERAMEGNCPVCHEYLFDSATPIKELPCGHFLHSSCFAEYARYAYTCPICCKSIGDMSVYFQMLDSLLASERQRLPAEYAGRQQSVLCQDCGRVGAASYHFVYHKCGSCSSYNTRVL